MGGWIGRSTSTPANSQRQEGERGSYCLTGTEFLRGLIKCFRNSNDGCTTWRVYLMPPKSTLKMIKMYVYFIEIKKDGGRGRCANMTLWMQSRASSTNQ